MPHYMFVLSLFIAKVEFKCFSSSAVKVLDWEDGTKTAAEAAEIRASFKQEVSVWHKLNHPNVTSVNI